MKKVWANSLFIGGAIVGIAATAAFSIELTLNSLTLESIQPIIDNKSSSIGSTNQDYEFENALQEDVQQKANSDSVLFYYINWDAIFHRIGPASHLLKILEANPKKEVVFIKRNNVNVDLSIINNNKEKYPNFKFINLDSIYLINSIQSVKTQDFFTQQVENELNKLKNEGKKIDLYIDDVFLMRPITTVIRHFTENDFYSTRDFEQIKNNLINNFQNLNNLNSINMFGDGTASVDFYNNSVYNAFLLAKNEIIDNKYKSSKFLNIENKDIYENINGIEDLILYLTYFITTNNKGNLEEKTKFFLPSKQMVDEINLDGANVLDLNIENKDFFNPYNSLEADLIAFCRTFDPELANDLYNILKVKDFNNDDYNFMDNSINHVLSGRLLQTEEIIKEEAQKLVNLYNEITKDPAIDPKKVNIIFKGHPRNAIPHIKDSLNWAIKGITGSGDPEWLKIVNPTIPYELYLINGVFMSDESKNKVVQLYVGYSTINLFLYADDPSLKDIKDILINQKEDATINSNFSKESKMFPSTKRKVN
ncbi:MAG: hypothetical protein KFW07_03210 [Mycoplasmataceae bacterium]|nr:hypothetical protein [Mycoplasmataceae bacterium]